MAVLNNQKCISLSTHVILQYQHSIIREQIECGYFPKHHHDLIDLGLLNMNMPSSSYYSSIFCLLDGWETPSSSKQLPIQWGIYRYMNGENGYPQHAPFIAPSHQIAMDFLPGRMNNGKWLLHQRKSDIQQFQNSLRLYGEYTHLHCCFLDCLNIL